MDERVDRSRWRLISDILDQVLDLTPSERSARLDELCGHDVELRREVDALVAASVMSETFLATPAAELVAPLAADIAEACERELDPAPGSSTVGAYRLVRELGEGGMGVVWLAERIDGQFQQRVAIKIIKQQALRSREAQRRFVQERQILARLQHPAIATLLDGGVTDQGTPYFVMECVEGLPVTTYCHERGLDVDSRLHAFLQVCDAVQHAHRNLIVHRDLKPSNILVTTDGRVKLLDFGIAKLLGDAETSAMSPQTIERALTPEYAAPEQVGGEPVGTSADVYALGVVLYELLTGERPYRVRMAGVAEVERAVLEQDAVPPSARASSASLRRRLTGDLDRVVLKALHKSPDRRYQSAEALATDIRRHLDGLPVTARGDGLWYRTWKFIGRHRIVVGAAALVVVSLVAGLVAATWQARRAALEARKAETVKEFLKSIFSAANPELTGRAPSVRELLDSGSQRIDVELAGQPEVQSEVARVIADAYEALGEYRGATTLLTSDLDRRRRRDGPRSVAVADLLRRIADAYYEQNDFDRAAPMYDEALSIMRERRGSRTPEIAELLWDIAGVRRNRGDLASAEALQKEALAIYSEVGGDDSRQANAVRESLSITYMQAGRFRESAALVERVTAWATGHFEPDNANALNARYNLAYAMHALGRFEEAARIAEDVAARQRRVIGPRHDRLAITLRLLGRALDSLGRSEEALQPIGEALTIHVGRFGRANVQVAHGMVWQAVVESHLGRLAEAERDSREALRIFSAQSGPPRADVPYVRACAAAVLADAGRLDEAEAVASSAVSDLRTGPGGGVFLGLALDILGDIARQRGEFAPAADLARQALRILENGLGSDHLSTAVARVHAGAAVWAAGDAATGEPLTRAGVGQLQKLFPAGHPELAAASFVLGQALQKGGRFEEARPLLQHAADWREAHFGPTDPRTVAARRALKSLRPRP